jgi:hypothetical protein
VDGQTYEIDFQGLNPLELASVNGHPKLFSLFLSDYGLRSPKDFQIPSKGGVVEVMQFVVAPILRRDKETMSLILDQVSHLWSMDQYQQILTLMKQTKWQDGVLLAMSSKTAALHFANSTLKERFRQVRDYLALAFRVEERN